MKCKRLLRINLTINSVDKLRSKNDPTAIRIGPNVLSTKIIIDFLYRWLLFIQFDLKISWGSVALRALKMDPAYVGTNISTIIAIKYSTVNAHLDVSLRFNYNREEIYMVFGKQ